MCKVVVDIKLSLDVISMYKLQLFISPEIAQIVCSEAKDVGSRCEPHIGYLQASYGPLAVVYRVTWRSKQSYRAVTLCRVVSRHLYWGCEFTSRFLAGIGGGMMFERRVQAANEKS